MTTKYRRESPHYEGWTARHSEWRNLTSAKTWINYLRRTIDVLEKDISKAGQLENKVIKSQINVDDDEAGTVQISIFVELDGDIKGANHDL